MHRADNHLVAIVERIDAKRQSNSSATSSQHDAATLLAHLTRCTSRRIARRARTFEYHFVAIGLKMLGSSGGTPHSQTMRTSAKKCSVPIDRRRTGKPRGVFRRGGNLRTRQQLCEIPLPRPVMKTFVKFASIRMHPQPRALRKKETTNPQIPPRW